ncbi:MAG: cryptochrome/photolyase family protein [Pyrinomonadaceae bacterium]
MKNTATLIYPHQLFRKNPALDGSDTVFIIEEPLLFSQYRFHKQKLVMHRASMKFYAEKLTQDCKKVRYVEFSELLRTGDVAGILAGDRVTHANFVQPVDNWLETRLSKALKTAGITETRFDSPMFINTTDEVADYFVGRKSFSMARFYQRERERRRILMEPTGGPVGGKFSFDAENRKKLPKNFQLPEIARPVKSQFVDEAIEYVDNNFGDNYGNADDFAYPITFEEADAWLDQFLIERLALFGDYEDAVSKNDDFLFHSVLTPMLNTGLLTPQEVIRKTLTFAQKHDTPLNSLEGFIRQILGWREFMRGIYVSIGGKQRTSNFWKHQRRLPESFWTASTGIDPLDDVIEKALKNAYSHHIERLMIVGNFMVLTEIHPDEAYRWFMELYIDAYDWVMVPNVYGMSLQSDGGSITTKPYISSSNYIKKMSDYGAGPWCGIWDGLYWRFIAKHEKFFLANPRLSMMPRLFAKMDAGKRESLINTAENFLTGFR